MCCDRMGAFVIASAAWLAVPGAAHPAAAQDAKAPYPGMAPVDAYLMPDRAAEIALARSAAPVSMFLVGTATWSDGTPVAHHGG